ncbi:hypothetical protein S7711_07073 [Stachybotrys chartarum IBT 7711]|uniref:DUF427 domain-containing protein n=1 Tax=Stachybotrys chartarum (strain CBS 109288 / IBT 7711) TaxID=1280523 RepID=A0A084AP69_STACB|nr:hypothetical protein S7711_07073 [Stachybotrys chartarum IBT 7711]
MSDLLQLGERLLRDGPKRLQPACRRVRVIHNGATIVDTAKAFYVWEHDYYPQFYVPLSDLKHSQWKDGEYATVKVENGDELVAFQVHLVVPGDGDRQEARTDRVLRFDRHDGSDKGTSDEKQSNAYQLLGLMRLDFGSFDHWLEEDVPIYVHPKDPFKRLDLLPSTRPIEVRIDGRTVAKATSAVHLHETSLPVRFYLPLASVDQSVLRPSELKTKCPYKGEAEYYHVDLGDGRVFKDIVWYYRYPIPDSAGIAGLLCFYNEKVDILLDGELLERPKTKFG